MNNQNPTPSNKVNLLLLIAIGNPCVKDSVTTCVRGAICVNGTCAPLL